MEKGWLQKQIAAGAVRGVVQFLVTWGLPLGVPVVTVAIGRLTDIPWFYVWLGALAAFAFIANGLLRFDEWRQTRRVQDKLAFSQMLVGKSINNPEGILIGIRVTSSANFPLDFTVEKLLTRLADRVPLIESLKGATSFEIPSNGYGWYWANEIAIPDPPKNGTLEGFAEYELSYGRKGQKRYVLKGKKQVVVRFNDEGLFVGAVYHEAA